MKTFLKLSKEEQKAIIVNVSQKLNIPTAIIEKDFWVCFALNYLFSDFKYNSFISFKGGTSLSKVYNCIKRFSEDIDLAIDWEIIGFEEEEVYIERDSKRKQDLFNKEANRKTSSYLKNIWLPLIERDFSKLLDEPFKLYIDIVDPQTICFQYPRIYNDPSILQIIRIEIGPLAESHPFLVKAINPYIVETYPTIFDHSHIGIKTIDIKRTFYEKITILHQEAHRINGKYPERYSRHYYDVYQIIQNNFINDFLDEIHILKQVIHFKNKFYPCNWAKYNDVLEGKCRLIPNQEAIQILSNDYDSMKNMFYDDYPTFDDIISQLKNFESIINNTMKTNAIKV